MSKKNERGIPFKKLAVCLLSSNGILSMPKKEAEKAFLTDKAKFLQDHGFTEEEVNKLIKDLQKSRLDELSSVLKDHGAKLN